MSETILGIRHKRYKLCEKVYLTITPTIGHEIVGVIDNCSIYGIGVTIEKKKASLDWESEVNNIIPASSIKWGDKEYNLGRIVLRYFLQSDPNKVYAGFSVIDYKVPISGFLSAIIDRPLSKNDCLDIEVNKEKCRVASFTQINFSNVDIFDRCRKFELFYKEWKKTPQYLYEEIRMPSKDVRINLSRNRKKNRNDYISMGSNDYYGLAFNEEVVDAAKNAMDLYGFGSTGSPLTTGLTKYHEELTDYISSLFNNSFNLSAISLTSKGLTNKAESASTSFAASILEANTGHPQAMDSIKGMPKPSYKLIKAKISAAFIKQGISCGSIQPGLIILFLFGLVFKTFSTSS